MADTVASKVLLNSPPFYSIQLTNTSDGTGEAAVKKVDKGDLTDLWGEEPYALDVVGMEWDIAGMNVRLLWDAATDDEIAVLTGSGVWDQRKAGPLKDPKSATNVGDILLTTVGHSSGDGYRIVLHLKMRRQ